MSIRKRQLRELFFFFFGSRPWHVEIPRPGIDLHHSGDPNHSSDNANLNLLSHQGIPNPFFLGPRFAPDFRLKLFSLRVSQIPVKES